MLIWLYFFIAFSLIVFLILAIVPVFLYKCKIGFKFVSAEVLVFSLAIVSFPVIAILLYLHWGASQQLGKFYAISEARAITQQEQGNKFEVEEVVGKLVTYLNAHPADAKGWYFLGRLYLDQNAIKKASESFKHSFENDPKNTEITAQYVQALYLNHRNQFTPRAMELLQKVLTEDPKNATLLNLLAMDGFRYHRYGVAITYWSRLRNQYPEDSQAFRSLTQWIEVSKEKLKKSKAN